MTLIHADCVEAMAGMDPESVDAIVTDPPYGLEFMGKEWDRISNKPEPRESLRFRAGQGPGGFGVNSDRLPSYRWSQGERCDACGRFKGGRTAQGSKCVCVEPKFRNVSRGPQMQQWHQQWAEAAYRVAKPSAYLLAFGGTRTVHRMTVALEDAGWVIRDMLVWAYASGFPKSRASLKPAWEPIVMARKPGPLRELAIDACRIGTDDVLQTSTVKTDIRGGNFGNGHRPEFEQHPAGRWPANVILTDPIFDGGWEGVVGGGDAGAAGVAVNRNKTSGEWSGNVVYGARPVVTEDATYGDSGTYSRFFVLPKADRTDREPVLDEYAYRLHRERGECDKLRAWEGADLSRNEPTGSTSPARATSEGTSTDDSGSDTSPHGSPRTAPSPTGSRSTTSTATSRTTGSRTSSSSIPSPTSASTPDANSVTASGGSPAGSADSSSPSANPTGISPLRAGRSTDDAAPATSRSWSSRNVCGRCGKPLPRVGSHPTVKPVDLMRHLVRLVTPTGGIVLDPFLGSGTTALAAEMEGFRWVGIEKEAEYVAIAEARLNGTQRGLGLETA